MISSPPYLDVSIDSCWFDLLIQQVSMIDGEESFFHEFKTSKKGLDRD